MILSTVIPHGDFLLHLGYRQRGYREKQLEEPFPEAFELPKESHDYRGYLPASAKGGFAYFFSLGYFKCALALVRTALVITFYYNNT